MIKGYKTFIFALALCVFSALEQFEYTHYLTEENADSALLIVGGITGVLRILTKTPIFKKENNDG